MVRVAELDAIVVEHGQGVGLDQTVEREDLVHLHRRGQRAPALLEDLLN